VLLTLIQSHCVPERYGIKAILDTMPSRSMQLGAVGKVFGVAQLAVARIKDELLEAVLAVRQRAPKQVLAVEVKEIERPHAPLTAPVVGNGARGSSPYSSHAVSSPSMMHDLTGRCVSAGRLS
jgi:hypothetical protein